MRGVVGATDHLLREDAALVDAAATTEAVMRHAHGKQEHTGDERCEK
jgi:hypothetical protein